MPDGTVRAQRRADGVLELRLDDGGPNALRPEVLAALTDAVAAHPDAPVLLTGRDGMFCAGLDLKWMATAGAAGLTELLAGCGRTLAALWLHPRPVVAAVSGHAVAAGTMLAMTADHVVAAEGGTWGLNETANGMELPDFALTLARSRVASRELTAVVLPGARVDAARAVAVGYADEAAPAAEVRARAEDRLAALSALPAPAYAANKRRLRGDVAAGMLARLDDDVAGLVASLHAAVS
jgi:enoyl-CoA hydratase